MRREASEKQQELDIKDEDCRVKDKNAHADYEQLASEKQRLETQLNGSYPTAN